jgi:hypothetical protein
MFTSLFCHVAVYMIALIISLFYPVLMIKSRIAAEKYMPQAQGQEELKRSILQKLVSSLSLSFCVSFQT